MYPIEYGSHILSENQVKKWSIAEKEAYALTLFLNKWKYYFYHRNDTIVYTDNITVKLLLESKKISRKLQRWKMSILQFNIIIKHISGFRNIIADFLSRSINPLLETNNNNIIH